MSAREGLDDHQEEYAILQRFLQQKKLKKSRKRDVIMNVFFGLHRHVTSEEVYRLAKKADTSIGYTTVYRTLKLLCESGLCAELKFDDGVTRYEHLYNHPHHDHLICTICSECIEFCQPEIEQMQVKVFVRYGYKPQHHKMELYGICSKCQS